MRSSTKSLGGPSFVWELAILLAFLPVGWAALSATCQPGWEWADNSLGQSPCQTAGYLQAPCLGFTSFVLGPLEPGQIYTAPGANDTKAQNCGCNTVIYSLYSACQACQGVATITPWWKWEANCPVVYVSEYPLSIPGDTAIPHWAFINVTILGNFNVDTAQGAGRDPEATGNIPVTLNLTSTSSTKSVPMITYTHSSPADSSSLPNPSPTNENSVNGATSKQNNVPAIVGGIVGGVAGLVIIALLLLWYLNRRLSRAPPPRDATRPLSARSLSFSARSRGSYYPPSIPVYAHEPETVERDWNVPEVYSRQDVLPREPVNNDQDTHSITSSVEFDVQTTYNSPHYIAQRENRGGLPY